MPSNSAPLLNVKALSARIGGQAVLRDVCLEVAQSEWLAVVGGSGAGKSTLLRAILGLTRPAVPSGGEIEFDGGRRALVPATRTRMEGIAFVPQSPAHGFDPLRRLRWQWAQLARRMNATDTQERQRSLAALGLPDFDACYPHQWSRGMQQRLLLAMALMGAPKLLILDEPTSALDPLIAAQVLQETRRLAREQGIAVMMVTHDLAMAARFADRIAIMQQGRIVETGTTERVLRHPEHSYSRELVAHRRWQRANSDIRHAAE